MQRWTMVMMMVVTGAALAGCGDSDDGGSTVRSICDTTCERALECVPESSVTQDACANECVDRAGGLRCDQVNEPNLASCLAGINALTCEQLERGEAPAICDMVCLVRIQSEGMLSSVQAALSE